MLRTALVTGATGFVGSRLVRRLVADGVDVHVVVRPTSSAPPDGVTVHTDPGDVAGLAEALAPVAADACFHLASRFVAEHRPDDVASLIESNIAFPARVAEALGDRPDLVFVNAGSAWQHVDGKPYSPADLYAATKQAFRDLLVYYSEAGRLRVVDLALFDTYGPDDQRPKLLNVMRRAQVNGTPLRMSPGDQLIDLVFVDDVVDALVAAAAAPAGAEYEVRSGRMLSLRDLFAVVEQVTGKPVPAVWGARPYRAKEMMTTWSTGRPVPGWSPKTELEEGIRLTWAD